MAAVALLLINAPAPFTPDPLMFSALALVLRIVWPFKSRVAPALRVTVPAVPVPSAVVEPSFRVPWLMTVEP